MKTNIRRVAPALLAALAGATAAGCGSTEIASTNADKILPKLSVAIEGTLGTEGHDSVSLRVPFHVVIDAQDNATIQWVVTRVFADTLLVGRDSTALPVASTTFSKKLKVTLPGVRPGQRIAVRSAVSDGAGNTVREEANAVAFDPNVPRVAFAQQQPTVIVGGTYTIELTASDTAGITKLGYRVTAPGFSRADSALFPVPYPRESRAPFALHLPPGLPAGTTLTLTPFAENRDALRGVAEPLLVRVTEAGPDLLPPLVYQTVPPRLETPDSLDVRAHDSDGLVRIVGFVVKDVSGRIVYRSADTLETPAQQVTRRRPWGAPISMRGQALFVTAYAVDASGRTGWAVPMGITVPVSTDTLAKRDPTVYAYGLTYDLDEGSLGADITIDQARTRVFVSNLVKNRVEAWSYSTTLQRLPAISVGAQPWGMTIDNSGSILLVANSAGTNISQVSLVDRREIGRVKTSNEYIYDVSYSKDESSGGFKFKVPPPIDYSDRPQFIAQSASGALYYSTLPTTQATPGTLRRIDNFLDTRAEPRQIWQYGAYKKGQYVIINADFVDVIEGKSGEADQIIVCEHTPGTSPDTATCVSSATVEAAVASLRADPINGNVEAIKDLDAASLALPDTNFVAVGGDRRRVAFGEGNTPTRSGRVLLVYDPSGTPANAAQYSAPIEVADLTNNASDKVYGLDINQNSSNIGVHGVETFFADSSLRLQGKFATFNTGAGIAFHPGNVDENTADSTARVVFVASGDKSIQIVDSYSYRLRGRIPIRENLYGALRATIPTPAERSADPTLVVKLFGLTKEGIVVIDVRSGDIDNVPR